MVYIVISYSFNLYGDIIIMPVIRAKRGPDTVKVSPLSKKARLKPFHLLYYSEARFLCGGHYQSIFPMNTEKGTNIIIIIIP